MRVALVHRFFWREGAVPAVARQWADRLEAAGHAVAVYASDVRPADASPGRVYVPVRVGRFKAFDEAGLAFAWRLARALRRQEPRPDVVMSLDSTAYFGAWAAGRRLRVPAVMSFRGWIYSPGKRGIYPRTVTWVYKLSARFCARRAPLVACLSEEIREGLLRLGARPERLWLAPNCVDLDLWRTAKDGAHRRAGRTVLFVGRFSKEKGIRELLEAAPAVVERMPQVRFRLVGGDEGEDGECHRLARRLGVLGHIDFAGKMPRESLPAVYGEADVLAAPSHAEGHANAPLEALACGTPVVGSDVPGIRETVQDGVNGLLVPSRDPAALAEALCRLLADEALLDRLSRAARPSVGKFSWDDRIAEFEARCAQLRARDER